MIEFIDGIHVLVVRAEPSRFMNTNESPHECAELSRIKSWIALKNSVIKSKYIGWDMPQ